MRKSQPTSGRRLFRAGLATTAVAAVVLAAAPPALAALSVNVAVTLSPPSGPVSGGTTVTANATNLLTDVVTAPSLQAEVRFVTATSCPTTLVSAVAGSNIAATSPTKINDDSMTFVTPATLAAVPTTYRVCIYGVASGTIANGAALIGSAATATSAFRTYIPGTLAPTTGPAGGGNQVTLSGTGVIGTATTVAATFTKGTGCPGTYITGSTSFAATTTTKTSANEATITVPATATAAAGPYKVCVYNGATATSLLLSASGVGNGAGANYAPSYPQAILSATAGKNGGGNTITATLAGAFTNVATPGVYFTTTACPVTYPNSPGNLAGTATATNDIATVTVPTGVLAPSNYNVCLYNGTTSGTSTQIAVGSATYGPSLPPVTLSPDSGSDATVTTITATSSTNDSFLLGVTTPKTVLVKGTACPSVYPTLNSTNIAATSDIRISNNKMALTVPNTVVYTSSDGNTSPWNVCIYTGTTNTDTLVATALYRVGATLTVTSISPTSGPAQGGSTVTVQGGGFTAGLTATIGGAEITNIVVAANGNSFTGVTTPRGAGANLALTVKTEAGSKSLSSAYSYTFGITVTPNTAPAGSIITLDVLGAGFESLAPFGTTGSNDTDAHVYLVRGGAGTATAYNPTDNAGAKTVPQIAECTNVLVISDLELLCTLDLTDTLTNAATPASAGAPVPEGTYTVTVVDSGAIAPTATIAKSLITSGSTFTVAPY
ncbi:MULTISPECIES: IPT/TIG domain-containing protein [Catenuloplanes]|uniref:IPT/TIG domain-containing protein n=1 Tax=Catenuloplanes niger TaxID=587534 RepID=A0AAE3ZPZ7_9ACTN|nr:IPT/TIG domain-containing protein [Catenuloplanes niger]MDR7323928.1 hypothetical protein [Catenuloplanes niger]